MHYQDLCELLERTRDDDLDQHCENLEHYLRAAPLDEVEGFHRCLVGVFDWLDTLELRTAAALILFGIQESSFAAFRGRLILAGKDALEAAAADPGALVDIEGRGWACERLLRIGPEIYEQRSDRRISAWTLDTLSIERPDNPPKGHLERFRERYPRLWAHFPLALGRTGRRRERSAMLPLSAHQTMGRWRTLFAVVAGLMLFGAQVLAVTGHWLLALVVFVAMLGVAGGGGYRAYLYVRDVFVEQLRSKGSGELSGTVRYRLIRITPPAGRGESHRAELTDGLSMVQREARRYGKDVRFVEDGPPTFLGCRHPESLRRAIRDARPRIEQMRDELREGEGPSFVMVVADAGDEAFANYVLQAACISSGNGKGTYAHEVLHLFGACDLYESNNLDQLWGQAIRRMAEDLFAFDFDPDVVSIMDDSDDERAQVDRFTARLLGWA